MAQTNWSLLGTPAQQIVNHSVGRNADGRLEVFYIDVNNEIWHIWQTAPNGTWSTLTLLNKLANASYYSSIAVDENADGRLEVFTVGTDGAFWHIWQTAPNGTWSSWAYLGTPSNVQSTTGLTVGKNADGRLEFFTVGTDGALWHISQNSPNGTFNTWTTLGTPPNMQFIPTGPAVVKN